MSVYLGWWAELGAKAREQDISGIIDDELATGEHATAGNSIDIGDNGPLGQMQSIFELDADCNVILQGRIGQGFYGEVYRGTLERESNKDEPQQVAIKKLKTRALEADLRDFEREIEIMKVK